MGPWECGSICGCRAGLYKQLAELKALVAEYREDPDKNTALKVPAAPSCFATVADCAGKLTAKLSALLPRVREALARCLPWKRSARRVVRRSKMSAGVTGVSGAVQGPIMENLLAAGLQEDCPPPAAAGSNGSGSAKSELTAQAAEGISTDVFAEYAGRLNQYLQVGGPPPRWDLQCVVAGFHEAAVPEVALVHPEGRGAWEVQHRQMRASKSVCLQKLPCCVEPCMPTGPKVTALSCSSTTLSQLPWPPPQVVEGRLFSEGLHVLGRPPAADQMRQYLSAYFGDGLPEVGVDAVVEAGDGGIAAVRHRLERSYHQVWYD